MFHMHPRLFSVIWQKGLINENWPVMKWALQTQASCSRIIPVFSIECMEPQTTSVLLKLMRSCMYSEKFNTAACSIFTADSTENRHLSQVLNTSSFQLDGILIDTGSAQSEESRKVIRQNSQWNSTDLHDDDDVVCLIQLDQRNGPEAFDFLFRASAKGLSPIDFARVQWFSDSHAAHVYFLWRFNSKGSKKMWKWA